MSEMRLKKHCVAAEVFVAHQSIFAEQTHYKQLSYTSSREEHSTGNLSVYLTVFSGFACQML